MTRTFIKYWSGESLQLLLEGMGDAEVDTAGLDAEWLSKASAARPRSGVNARTGLPLQDGRVAVLQIATLERVLGAHVHVISLSAYDKQPVASFPPELVHACCG